MIKKPSHAESRFMITWKAIGGQKYNRETKFHPERRWKIDFTWDNAMVAVEVEGGVWLGGLGGHTSGKGYTNNCEKYNEAAFMGWTVFRLVPAQITVDNLKKIKNFIEKRLTNDKSLYIKAQQ